MRRLFLVLFIAFFFVAGGVTPVIAEDVELAWDANTDVDLWGYRVYRTLTPGSHVLAGVSGTSPHLIDFVACGPNDTSCAGYWELLLPDSTTFYWVVTAVDNAGNESGKSNEVSHTTALPYDPPPNDPSGCYIRTVVP